MKEQGKLTDLKEQGKVIKKEQGKVMTDVIFYSYRFLDLENKSDHFFLS